jgi:hypothetical protein
VAHPSPLRIHRTPNSLSSEGEYNVSMRLSVRQFLSRGTASLLMLCLLIAPLCAARCNLTSCLPSSVPQQAPGGCHHAVAKSHGTANLAALPTISCQTADALLAALPAQQIRALQSSSNHGAHTLFAALFSPITRTSDHAITLCVSLQSSSPGDFPFPSSVTPLRI